MKSKLYTVSQKPAQRQAWAVKVHWGGEAVLSQLYTQPSFQQCTVTEGGAAHARMKPVIPTSQTHSGLPFALHSRTLPFSGAFLHSFPLGGSCCYHRNKPHHLTAALLDMCLLKHTCMHAHTDMNTHGINAKQQKIPNQTSPPKISAC